MICRASSNTTDATTDERPHEAVETEALSQTLIVQILRDCLSELMPEPLETVQERAEKQRTALEAYLRRFGGRQPRRRKRET